MRRETWPIEKNLRKALLYHQTKKVHHPTIVYDSGQPHKLGVKAVALRPIVCGLSHYQVYCICTWRIHL